MRSRLQSRCGMLFVALWLALAPAGARAEGVSEAGLKAAFLYYFMLYTEWPVMPEDFRICLLGQTSFEPALQAITRKEIAGRPIHITLLAAEPVTTACNLLFVAPQEEGRLGDLAKTLADQPVLVVAENGPYNPKLVMLRIGNENGILGFEANLTAARNAGLRFSAKLLRLARKTY